MPIREADPWRFQYFDKIACPPGVDIPTEDSDAWTWNPAHAWVYDKLRVAQSQGLACGPHGTAPPSFPVFSKPVSNLRGMGAHSRIIASAADYEAHFTPGHMWVTLLEGRHVSTDFAVVDGEPKWRRHATGKAAGEGTFDYWVVHAAPDQSLERYCEDWIRQNLAGYTGIVNLETIGGKIIEVHLRFSDQWPDLYGSGWVEAVIRLYHRRTWDFADAERREGYSVVLFGPPARSAKVGTGFASDRVGDLNLARNPGGRLVPTQSDCVPGQSYRHPPRESVNEVLKMPGVSSVQITFHEDRPPERHAMPPGGFRLAIVNAWDLAAGLAARDVLTSQFFVR